MGAKLATLSGSELCVVIDYHFVFSRKKLTKTGFAMDSLIHWVLDFDTNYAEPLLQRRALSQLVTG